MSSFGIRLQHPTLQRKLQSLASVEAELFGQFRNINFPSRVGSFLRAQERFTNTSHSTAPASSAALSPPSTKSHYSEPWLCFLAQVKLEHDARQLRSQIFASIAARAKAEARLAQARKRGRRMQGLMICVSRLREFIHCSRYGSVSF